MSTFFHNEETGREQAAFHIRITSNIEKAEALLKGIPGGAETALDKALAKARRTHSKLAEAAIVKEYNITSIALHKKDKGRSRIKPQYKKMVNANGHGFVHEILYSGYLIPLAEFHRNPTDRRIKPVRQYYKTRWKGHPPGVYHFRSSESPNIHVEKESKAEKIRRSFVARVHAGKTAFHTGIFERTEEKAKMINVAGINVIDGDSTIAQKYGPSTEHMISNEKVREEIDVGIQKNTEEILDEMIGRILEGKIAV